MEPVDPSETEPKVEADTSDELVDTSKTPPDTEDHVGDTDPPEPPEHFPTEEGRTNPDTRDRDDSEQPAPEPSDPTTPELPTGRFIPTERTPGDPGTPGPLPSAPVQQGLPPATPGPNEIPDSTTNMAATPGLRKPEVFSGANPEEFPAWLAKFEAIAKAGGWEAKRHEVLPTYLTQQAFQIYEGLADTETNTFDNLRKALERKFGLGENALAWKVQLRGLKRGPDENIDKYAYKLRNLAKQAYPRLTPQERETLVNEQFVMGQPKDLQFELLRNGEVPLERNIELSKLYMTAINLAQSKRQVNVAIEEQEAPQDHEKSGELKASAPANTEGTAVAHLAGLMQDFVTEQHSVNVALTRMLGANAVKARVNTTFQGKCFKCDMMGHMARDCRAQPLLSPTRAVECYRCHRFGHISRDCPSNSGGNWANSANQGGGWTRSGQGLACRKCGNKGHTADQCRTDMTKTCQYCSKKGHLVHECRSLPDNNAAGNSEPLQKVIGSKNLLTPSNQGAEWS